MFIRSAQAAFEATKVFKLCFDDDNAPYGLIDLLSGGAPASALSIATRSG
jgi:hypothetical protein